MNYPVAEGFLTYECPNEVDLCVLPEVVEVATVIGARDEVEVSASRRSTVGSLAILGEELRVEIVMMELSSQRYISLLSIIVPIET